MLNTVFLVEVGGFNLVAGRQELIEAQNQFTMSAKQRLDATNHAIRVDAENSKIK
jgi:hypothetical protein